MAKPSNPPLSSPLPWQLERLHQWCLEWTIDRALQEPAPPPTAPAEPIDERAQWQPPAPLPQGCIGLLAPRDDEPDAPPLYLAMLTDPARSGWLAIPFSRFTVPATPGEMISGRPAAALRVLALWNSRSLANSLTGWVLESLTDREVAQLSRAVSAVRATGRLPADLAATGGPPLTHPDDPRRLYLHEARQAMNRYAAPPPCRLFHYPAPASSADALPRAAEDSPEYGRPGDLPPAAPPSHDKAT